MVTFIVDLYQFSPNGLYLACLNHTEKQIVVRQCDDSTSNRRRSTSSNVSNDENRFKVECKFNLSYNCDPRNVMASSSSTSSSGVSSASSTSCRLVPVDTIQWSPDSCFLATSCKKYATICLFSLLDAEWKCKVALGQDPHGLESFVWGRDARHLVCVARDNSFLTIWSIKARQVTCIKDLCPIENAAGLSYSSDGSSLAVAQISSTLSPSALYQVGIYSASSLQSSLGSLQLTFPIISKDPAGISWCPGGASDSICIWDSNLFSNLYVYSTRNGDLLKQYSPYGMTSSGFNSVQWTAGGELVACTAQNKNELHVLNGLTFGVLIHDVLEPETPGFPVIADGTISEMGRYEIFSETNKNPSLGMNTYQRLSKWPSISLDSDTLLSLQVHQTPSPLTTRIKLSSDGCYLAATTQFYSHILWIYDLIFTATPIAVLIHQRPVIDFDWNPNPTFHNDLAKPSHKLVIICRSSESSRGLLYFWASTSSSTGTTNNKSTAYIHNTPAKFSFSGVQWGPLGDVLLIKDNSQRIHLLSNL